MSAIELSARHLADLRASGLTDDTIAICGAYTEHDPMRICSILNWIDKKSGEPYPVKQLGSCLVFPFVNMAGEPLHYCRVKPDRPVTHAGGKAPAKYESPKGRGTHVYLTPRARELAANPHRPLLFTEGEKKALAADQHNYACVGLVGTWGWVKPKEKDADGDLIEPGGDKELHPELTAFAYPNRPVYVVFDSDSVYKGNVRHAEWELAMALERAGACVRVVRLPQTLGPRKVGLDDYLKEYGRDAFEKLLGQSAGPTRPHRCFANVVQMRHPTEDGKMIDVPRSAPDIALELTGRSGGWPRVVSGVLVGPDPKDGTRPLTNHHQLFAFASDVFNTGGLSGVHWEKGPKHVSPPQFYEYLAGRAERFDRTDTLPHVPPIPGALYVRDHKPTEGKKLAALTKFLGFFRPASPCDMTLLTAALMTPMWGGASGKRPAFLFEAEDEDTKGGRGVGKSTVAQKFAKFYGGALDIDPSEPFHKTRSRFLTPDATGKRILLMDNVKTFRLSSSDLESLVTATEINGHRYYRGQAGVPNYYTLFITLNGASLSRDFAQRVIPVRLKRAEMKDGWENEVDEFLNQCSGELVSDLMALLARPAAKLSVLSRWGPWENGVLARLRGAEEALRSVDERTATMDADGEDAERIRDTFRKIVKEYEVSRKDCDRWKYLLDSSAYTKLVEIALNSKFTGAAASAQLKSLSIPEMRKSNRRGFPYWLWTGAKMEPAAAARAWPVWVSYHEDKGWQLESAEKSFLDASEGSEPGDLGAEIDD